MDNRRHPGLGIALRDTAAPETAALAVSGRPGAKTTRARAVRGRGACEAYVL